MKNRNHRFRPNLTQKNIFRILWHINTFMLTQLNSTKYAPIIFPKFLFIPLLHNILKFQTTNDRAGNYNGGLKNNKVDPSMPVRK